METKNGFKIYQLDEIMIFGKYELDKLTLHQVIMKDPEYVQFCLNHVSWFFISDDAKSCLTNRFKEIREDENFNRNIDEFILKRKGKTNE